MQKVHFFPESVTNASLGECQLVSTASLEAFERYHAQAYLIRTSAVAVLYLRWWLFLSPLLFGAVMDFTLFHILILLLNYLKNQIVIYEIVGAAIVSFFQLF